MEKVNPDFLEVYLELYLLGGEDSEVLYLNTG